MVFDPAGRITLIQLVVIERDEQTRNVISRKWQALEFPSRVATCLLHVKLTNGVAVIENPVIEELTKSVFVGICLEHVIDSLYKFGREGGL